jgi:hypothetical protein
MLRLVATKHARLARCTNELDCGHSEHPAAEVRPGSAKKTTTVRQTSPSFPRSRRRGGSFSALLASELQALASLAATPEGRSALAKLPALGAVLTPIVERQIADAERDFRER